jgi:hypothetical protein
MKQTEPNVHDVLRAIKELEKLSVVQAYNALLQSLKGTSPVSRRRMS